MTAIQPPRYPQTAPASLVRARIAPGLAALRRVALSLTAFRRTAFRRTAFRRTALRRVALSLTALSLTGCGAVYHVVSWGAGGYLEDGALAFQREPDPRLAAEAIPANFKLLEVLLIKTPNDPKLLTLASEYIATYAYAFIEPQTELLELSDPDGAAEAKGRATDLYLRGRDFGLHSLAGRKAFTKGLDGTPEELAAGLKSLGKAQLPALFWTAFCWGSFINMNLDDPQALADSGKVSAMMARVLELDETYYYGGAHLFFGALSARLPAGAGGDAAKSRQHFERALAISGGRLLMTKVFFARYYAVRVQDRALFESSLNEVVSTDVRAWRDERLANELAKERARFYLEHVDEYFLDAGPAPTGEQP